jgi:hypothetical protein
VRAKPAAKAAIDFVAFTARLEAAPFKIGRFKAERQRSSATCGRTITFDDWGCEWIIY